MLIAEIHGKIVPEAQTSEDYLTSAVFGHLRYVPPFVFWEQLFQFAKGLPRADGIQHSLSEVVLEQIGRRMSEYASLEIHFWPKHPDYGEPDMLLCFSGPGLLPLVILIEAKYEAEKSGTGEKDQLYGYLKILDDLDPLNLALPNHPVTALVYLTPRESIGEVMDTALCADEAERSRLYRLQWQDIILAANESMGTAEVRSRKVLGEIVSFLHRRQLEYFDGFRRLILSELPTPIAFRFYVSTRDFAGMLMTHLPVLEVGEASYYISGGSFEGFTELHTLNLLTILKGGWMP
jgi:hypothetical protein